MDEMVIRDDSQADGLRQMHVMRMGARVDRERYESEVALHGGVVFCLNEYQEDEAGLCIWHLFIAWRLMMDAMWVVHVDQGPGVRGQGSGEGAARAAGKYYARYQRWPNRAAVRPGMMHPEEVELMVSGPQGGEVVGRVRFVEMQGMRMGDVGVFFEEVVSE